MIILIYGMSALIILYIEEIDFTIDGVEILLLEFPILYLHQIKLDATINNKTCLLITQCFVMYVSCNASLIYHT